MTAHPRFTPNPRPQPVEAPQVARYDLAWLDGGGRPCWDSVHLPDMPEIESAVASLGRGAMLMGVRGPIAIEDLMPGDRVATRGGGTAQIDWIGARTYAHGGRRPRLFRIGAHAFGAHGPDVDVMVGADAHVLLDHARCVPLVGASEAYAPVAAFADGHDVSEVSPQGDVTVYGLACAGQEALMVSGMAVASYHPAQATGRSLNRSILAELTRLFPQAGTVGFGAPRVPHLTPSEAMGLALAGV